MKKSIHLSIFILLFTVTTHAQEDKSLYLYHTSAQFQALDFTGFNQQLDNLNLLSLPNNTVEIGAGVTRLYRRFSTELTLVFGIEENRLDDDVTGPKSRFRYAGLRLSESFNVLNPESNWFLGPQIALNSSFQQISVVGRNNGKNFQEAALNAVYNFERFSFTMDAGLTFHKFIQYNDAFGQARNMILGLRSGYRFDYENPEWNLNQIITLDNLGIVTGGWFGAVTFGVSLF